MDCILCAEETESKEQGICLKCQKKIGEALGFKVEFLDEDPYVKVTPKAKEVLYDLIYALSQLAGSVDYNFQAIQHHSHSTKQVEVVDIE